MAVTVPDRGIQLIAILWVLTGAATSTVVFRFLARAQKSGIGWDDIFMLVSLLCFYGWSICLTILSARGGERHIQDVVTLGPDIIAEVQLLNWTSQVFGIFGVGTGKVSVSALLLTILRNTGRAWQAVYIWAVCVILVMCICISCSILTFAQCHPAAALWDTRIQGNCIDPQIMANFGIFTGAYNTFVDFSLALIPTTIFWSLQMSVQERIQLAMVFALNILTSICSGIKTSYLSQLANRTDFTWATYDIFVWVTAELFLVIFCGSAPTLKLILNFIRWHILRVPTSRKASGQSHRRYTRETHSNQKEEIRLTPMRPEVTSNHTMVSASGEGSHSNDDAGSHDDQKNEVIIQTAYETRVD